jgi:von Willebrand factor type A domain
MSRVSVGIWLFLISAWLPMGAIAQSCNTAERSVLLILDSSGSMNAKLPNGETRIAVAKRAIKGVAGYIPAQAQISLRMYGAQSAARQKNCQDTHVAVPFQPAQSGGTAIGAAADAVKAQGYTPIAYSLEQAANDFPPNAKERVIVLVSDGKETCRGDPVVAAKALVGKHITVHTVGFIVDTAARGQLQNIARITGGTYFDAPVGPELPETLKKAFEACKQRVVMLPPRPRPGKLRTTSAVSPLKVFESESGKPVGQLDRATMQLNLPAGIYEVRFGKGGGWKGIEVHPDEITTIEPGELRIENRVGVVRIVDSETGDQHGQIDAANPSATLMPGLYDLRYGKTVWPFVKVDGGKALTLKAAMVILDRNIKWHKRARVATKSGAEVFRFDAVSHRAALPPGEYVIEIDDNKIPFNATEGEVLDVKPQ